MTKFIFHIETLIVDEPAGFVDRIELPIDGDAIEAPVFETHKRGKNWSCFFTGKNAANADRHFLAQRGRVIDISRLELGMPIEIAGDYTSSGGTPHPSRFIGVVTSKTDTTLIVDQYASVAKAISAGRKGIVAVPLPDDSEVLEAMADPGPLTVDPQALATSVAELETWLNEGEGILNVVTNEVSFGESIALVLHELKRLQHKENTDVAHSAAA